MGGMLLFVFNSACLGVGLAMDAFSVSLANGLHDPKMSVRRMCGIAGTFAWFQFLMPMIGWVCVHTIVQYFQVFEKLIPWIALGLLLYIGGSMIMGALHPDEEEKEETSLSFMSLMMQGIATSIDALSVGFTIADYGLAAAFAASLIIAVVTFVICYQGLILGKKFGTRFSSKAELLGGVILVLIGLEIFVTGVWMR